MQYQKIPKTKRAIFYSNRELIVSLGVVLLCLFASLLFPTKNSAQLITKSLFFLVLLPIGYIKIILKQNISEFGWNLKNPKIGFLLSGLTLLFTLLLFYLLINYTSFESTYSLDLRIRNNFWFFLAYELLAVNLTLFIIGFFFQGFILSLFRKKFFYFAIPIQTGLFFLLLFLTKNLSWQTAPLIFLSVTAGFLALKQSLFFIRIL